MLAEARRLQGHTQAQAAEAIGVSAPTISRWESGEDAPHSRHVAAIAGYVDAPEAKVLGAIHRQLTVESSDERLEAAISELRGELAELREIVRKLS